jgi:formylglycine-generating enzyme required for sulfatase activity
MKKIAVFSIALLTAATALYSCDEITSKNYVEDANCDLDMKMIYVEGGSFHMGATPEQMDSASGDEYPVHTVTLDSFYIGECEVTQAQWEKIMGTSIFRQQLKANCYSGPAGYGDEYPMHFVNWAEAQDFCRELSRITGKTYMLPTEAQWEYAARGGKNNERTKYCGNDHLDAVGWNHVRSSYPVKQKRPNSLGIYDMSGNVWEWCSDWYSESYYSFSPQRNPSGPGSGIRRMLRGGSWTSSESDCRTTNRARSNPSDRDDNNGFRVICLP